MKPWIKKITCIGLAALVLTSTCSAAMEGGRVVRVSAAANLSDALKTIGEHFTRIKPGVELQFNFGSSGALAQQIGNGAPADLFFSASEKWMAHLVENGTVVKGTVREIAANSLVIVSLKATPLSRLSDVVRFEKIAMGSPGSTPVGEYTEQALTAAGVKETLTAASKLVLAKDVRQALLYADRGEADIAFVYKTDALLAEKAKIVYTVPSKLHKPIVSIVGLTVQGSANAAAHAFYDFMGSRDTRAVLASFGYGVIPAPPAAKKK